RIATPTEHGTSHRTRPRREERNEIRARRLHRLHPRLSVADLAAADAILPLPAQLLRICERGDRPPRRPRRHPADGAAASAVPSLGRRRLRPGTRILPARRPPLRRAAGALSGRGLPSSIFPRETPRRTRPPHGPAQPSY